LVNQFGAPIFYELLKFKLMKKILLFIALIASSTFFAQTELIKNSTCDIHGTGADTSNTSDNADAWDMTPNSTLNGDITSPYRYDADDNVNGWYNATLETYLKDTTNSGDSVNTQPGSTSDGAYDGETKTRGLKLYNDGKKLATGNPTARRIYQKIILEAGVDYTFSIDSRSEADNTQSEVFILNEEITTEAGLDDGVADSRVDAYFKITNDFTGDKKVFATNTFDFTSTKTTVVIYVRPINTINTDTEIFFDNISLVKKATASVNDVFSSKISIYPNPANEFVQISTSETITGVEVYNLIGKRVISSSKLTNNKIDVSNLSKGVYILKVMSNDLVGSRKIIIE
jgi:hypothetical protein